ncbi:hypothetical protein PUNSTDRAFT_128941 [Punctularia strigosozonata HHB-11173 SS5]|uniref:uncharacterized protein n=1 Tax=Punctularia strigosozonata (strain HHB-11173) TaxID=741275 RepID=UPI0004418077|nr:uncharacterized protein PUNSTDRAFT_128941 [Punctularia strigosozonata HHB-11173 SS5]EIN13254.1 hypothetical protein PUNSTDRAFT_128941 [Punctularia strigosozonata HHB-11173 SS5]
MSASVPALRDGVYTPYAKSQPRGPFLRLSDPMFVIEIITNPSLTVVDEATIWLLERGITFGSYEIQRHVHDNSIVFAPQVPTFPRAVDHLYTPDDYDTYTEVRDAYLWDHPSVLHAAMLSGGILWRIVHHLLDYSVALDGPSANADRDGHRIMLTLADRNVELCDDRLRTAEIELIISQTSTGLSWWPHPNMWRNLVVDRGWWSENAENFFQHQLERYSSPQTCQPSLRTTWKAKQLKLDRRVQHLMDGAKKHVAIALDRLITRLRRAALIALQIFAYVASDVGRRISTTGAEDPLMGY